MERNMARLKSGGADSVFHRLEKKSLKTRKSYLPDPRTPVIYLTRSIKLQRNIEAKNFQYKKNNNI